MPEGVEAKIIAESIDKLINGALLTDLTLMERSKYYKDDGIKIPGIEYLEQAKYITEVKSVGKKVFFIFEKCIIIFSLGMAGHFRLEEAKCTELILKFTKNDKEITLYYDNARSSNKGGIGDINIVATDEELLNVIDINVPDPLNEEIDYETWKKAFNYPKSQRQLRSALICQEIILGLGNYLRSCVLHRAELCPFDKICDLSEDDFKILIENIVYVMHDSYSKGGHSLRDFKHLDGSSGKYIPRAYGRDVDDNGYKVEKFKEGKSKSARVLYWVPEVQKSKRKK